MLDRWREHKANAAFRSRSLPDVEGHGEPPEHIVIVVVDALRADFDRSAAPFIESLDGGSAAAPSTWTFPSVLSILTGQYPHEHGSMRQSDDLDTGSHDNARLPPKLSDSTVTLPELMQGAGFDTFGAFGFAVPFLAAKGRFSKHRLFNQAPAEVVLDSYRQWRENRDGPTFAYLHLFDLHGPFENTPPSEYWDSHNVDRDVTGTRSWKYTDQWEGEEVQAYQRQRKRLYDAALDYVDDELHRFADDIESRSEGTALLVMGDHGDAFWEFAQFDADRFEDTRPAYSVGHGGTPYESISKVPLRARGIDIKSERTSLIDVTPTILDTLNIRAPPSMSGISHHQDIPEERLLLTEACAFGYEKKAVMSDHWKLIVSKKDDAKAGFKLPSESPTDVPTAKETELMEYLPDWPGGNDERIVSDNVQRRLEELGYK